MSVQNKIVEYLQRNGGWVSGNDLENMAKYFGSKPSIVGRRARELEKIGKIVKDYDKIDGRDCVKYRFKATQDPATPKEAESYELFPDPQLELLNVPYRHY